MVVRSCQNLADCLNAKLSQLGVERFLGNGKILGKVYVIVAIAPMSKDEGAISLRGSGSEEARVIVWLASYPRSGNTLLRLLLTRMYGVTTQDVYVPRLSANVDESAMADKEITNHADMKSMDEMRASKEPYFIKTHELPSDNQPAIYVIRDGRDTLTSYAHFILAYTRKPAERDYQAAFHLALQELVEYDESFGGWSRHVQKWCGRNAPTVILKYEELVVDPKPMVRQALLDLGVTLTEDMDAEIPAFGELKQRVPKFFRSGKSGAYKQEMTDPEHRRFWERHGAVMRMMGYTDGDPARFSVRVPAFFRRLSGRAA